MMNDIKLEKKIESKNYIKLIENKFIENSFVFKSFKEGINVGDILRIGYIIPEGDKERTQYYEGLVIAKKNKGLGKTFTLRRTVQGIGIEQIFVLNSPKIVSILKKQESKIRRAKLYFIRNLKGKATRLKKMV
jgi:large subunit ribosomal protein L19